MRTHLTGTQTACQRTLLRRNLTVRCGVKAVVAESLECDFPPFVTTASNETQAAVGGTKPGRYLELRCRQ